MARRRSSSSSWVREVLLIIATPMPGLVCVAPVRAVPHVPHLAEEHEAGAPSPPSETASSTSPRFLHRQGPGGGRRAGDQPRQERRGGRRPYSLISLMIDTLAIIFRWPSSALKKQGKVVVEQAPSSRQTGLEVGRIRRRLSMAVVRANQMVLLARLGMVGEGSAMAGRRRSWQRVEEQRMRMARESIK